MGMTYEEAISQLTAPGAAFEITEATLRGESYRVFRNTPPSLRALFDAARARGDAPFLVYEDETWSFAEVMRHADALGAALVARYGIAPGDRVSIAMRNFPEWIIAFAAITSVGAVAVTLNAWWTADETEYGLRDSGSRVLIADRERIERATGVLADSALRGIVVRSEGEALPTGVDRYEDVVVPGTPMPEVAIDPHGDATILYTSGTTGRPKGAMLTHLNVWHSLKHFELAHRLGADERSLLAVPATHVTGLVAIILSMINVGGAILLFPVFKARDVLELAARERMTHTVLVPAMYNLLLREPQRTAHDLSHWRLGSYGGAPMPEAAIVALGEWLPHLSLVNGYGATETTSPTSLTPIGEGLARRETVGKPVHCAEVIVVDDAGCEVARGAAGEIWIRGPMVVPGYWRDPQATSASFTAGFWHSGDIGSLDAEGYLRLIDRKKDMINRGGYKIYSVEVENVLAEFPGVFECAVVAKACPVLGERVHAYVSRTTPEISAESISRFCASRLADYKVPETFTLMDHPLPRSSAGKVLKRVLREQLMENVS
jgi:O-succinylbenzoic acid--CoA ligase